MSKIITKIDPYEIDGKARTGLAQETNELHVISHDIRNSWVVLRWGGHAIAVSADELKRAISNATNHG